MHTTISVVKVVISFDKSKFLFRYFMGKRGRNSDADFDFSCRDLNVMGLWIAPFQMLIVFMLWPIRLAMNE